VILLDTHTLAWSATEQERLSHAAKVAIAKARGHGGLGIASITLWELGLAFFRGRLQTTGSVQAAVEGFSSGVTIQELTPEIVSIAAQLPEPYPRDPADRLIGATALALGIPLVTADASIIASRAVETIW
jgi:PIN domain nuclease of toxin-antitoxin system